MNGVLVVDKPRGPTSFDVVARVRRATGVKRVGHAGTLDPMASGVLPVCVGEATKLVPFLMAGEKVYVAEARLGVTTDTFDADGKILDERDASHVTRAEVEAALAGFVGAIRQVPPMHSALRVGGKRLYELAREGVEIEREPRDVHIFEARVDDFTDGRVRFTIRCGKGTYVRSLAADLGARLGTGAHLIALRRTRVGRFTVEQAIPLDAVDAIEGTQLALVDPAGALDHLPALALDPAQARDVRDGKVNVVAALPAASDGYTRLLRPDGTLLAVAERASGALRLVRVFS
ncbi:MAG TPA: tRNA pseudouridine(55) synthase TruB [Polyangia bacterium]|nr:tRNA pseudouridine(55) synthase TruB [Polyangia bacterium]